MAEYRLADGEYAAPFLDLPAPTITAYRHLGVLHERDADGDDLQICTELLGGRLFLALVQRTGTHDGHGWTDAPVRMAAHRRSRLARSPVPS